MQGVAPQNRHIKIVTQAFLSVYWDQKKPLLLGYSGGPDSKALLYSLIDLGIFPHIAHVDHGWRDSSKEEAELFKKEAESLGCPFFSKRLDVLKKENEAREGRLDFFKTLFPGYAAVMLAHNLNDLAETVLKRVLEGSHLVNFSSMTPVSEQRGVVLWRPFLSLERKEILAYLDQKGLSFFEDPSNLDPAYLRARLRKEILPFLTQSFGKEVLHNLALLSARSLELKSYLDRKTESVLKIKGPWGTIFDLKDLEPIEIRHRLQKIARAESMTFPRSVIETLVKWVLSKQPSKRLSWENKKIFVDKGRIWISSKL